MDLQTLTNLFATTYNPDPNIRKSAELQIRKIANEEGVIGALLQIIANASIEAATRQACAVWLKNRVYKTYALETDRRPDQPFIGNADRESLRSSVLHLLATSPSRAITTQLGAALKTIIAHDFPEKWPGLIPQIKQLLQSNSVQEVHAGCIAALEAVRAFKFRQTADVLPGIIGELFPILVSIATQMAGQTPTSAQEIPTMLHLILKTYKSSITVNLSAHQQSAESIVPWGKLFFAIVNLQLPAESTPADEEGRERSEWWRTKKWAYAILGRLFHRFGNPSQLPSTMQKEYGTFAAHFVDQFAPEILSTYLKQVNLFVNKQAWLSKKCQYHIFTFFTACVKPKSTWVLLKPHAQTLVSTFVFSQLTFNEERKELWNTDPVDYVRVSVDEYENYSSPVAAATTFLLSLATNRTKIAFMPILAFVNQVLRSNASPQERFGALNMVAALGTHIMSHPEVKTEMEQFILSFVTPALSASEPYLRAIALEILGTVVKHGLQWSNPQQLMSHSQAAAQALDDSEFPVQVQGALALTEMVTAYDEVRQAVAPQVGKVVHALVKMSDDTDLSVVNAAMEVIVEQYQVELLPVAAELVAHLCATYMRYVQEIASKEADADPTQIEFDDISGDDNDKSFSAMGVAKTILTVVDSIEESKEILAQVQEIIVPILISTLEHKLIDLFDYVYELSDSLTFHSRSIAPSMWRVFELTYSAFKTDAVDFLEEMLPTLDNFISYGADNIKGNNDYKRMLVDIYTTSLSVEHLGENDKVNGSKLAESILLNLRGSVDDYLHIIINAALSLLDQPVTQALRLANLEVLVNAVLYNSVAALHIMETKQAGTARKFFDLWFAAINGDNKLPRVHDKKLSILTLSALMEVPAANVPDSLRDGWPGIVGGALRLFKDLPKAIEVRKALQAEYDAGEEVDDTYAEKLLNFNDEEGDVWDDESAYLEMLANESARLRAKSERQGDGSTADSDSDEEEELIEEELTYISPIETVDAYTTFKRALTTLQVQNGPAYQAATTALDVDQQTLLMEVMRIADANATAAA
ncbi:hypothetical protein EST38_g469 [Candolleomyces aberdarensis]|uniref:Importin N-terminal domain-containing protein n=1 Tax=Candolleomyces aberdarensis TaxID=2316362 RepID=A0A4Q2E1W5_9AGAR|nr:hypothetical protein EST38_g469 [Candolleomyces aberdarensis]